MSLPAAVLVPAEPATPMYWRRTFPGDAAQVRAARTFAAFLLPGFPTLDDVLLTIDELAVNAIRHTRSGHFTVEVRHNPTGVTVSVTDQGAPTEPRVQPLTDPTALTESGRGLLTVTALATTWHWTGTPTSRTVHATFAAPAPRP
ncbi:Anti-sigma regulatory factor (Ser/Thr protein kinase) [Thermomonospora echinospora]|uniref:Anti-sigma regulatory factor (Ser/Thr protein kinase) n=1 Tax=Thermomonospora echinospora TaxID=1992 RepID=A0A1H6AYN9_9ACTN|nr:ATP-binding protein [Thermomonospora echinospora]SEG53157.1 Anti-sigma regulatory factor (Ser/Thr protein kinase) [Thermomonospora echinospora]